MDCQRLTMSVTSSDHARRPYALLLRAHGMCHVTLQAIFRSVAIAKLLYASSTWTGFTKATDHQRVDGFLRRTIRSGYCSPDTPTFAKQCATVDEQLFNNICHNQNHVLYSLLPPPTTASQNYHLRPRAHSQQLPQHTGHLTDSNFITRMLFTDICLSTKPSYHSTDDDVKITVHNNLINYC